MKKLYIVLSLFIIILSTGCSEINNKDELTIYTTNYAQKFILESIGQEYVNAYSIYDNTNEFNLEDSDNFEYIVRDPNTFSFKDYPEVLNSVLEADMFIYNGKSSKDTVVLDELVSDTKSEDIPLLDSTKNADISTVEKNMGLSYNGQVVDSNIKTVLNTNHELEMFWLSPIEMQNVSTEIYNFLIDAMPSKKEYFEKNFDALMFDLDSLYASIEAISSNTINNMIVSDSLELNVLKIHYIENIYLNIENDEYMDEISNYITIENSLSISTTDPSSQNYFDLAEVQSVENYENGMRYYEIMLTNYTTLERVLQ
ncbi:MAG: metal ABC transporter solute-binding protein, Zn/Mn family [Bacilli bacterium]